MESGLTRKQIVSVEEIPESGSEFLFIDELKDNLDIKNVKLTRTHFLRMGLKNAQIKNSQLTQCEFRDSYLRNAKFINTDFTGSSFLDCNLEKANFRSCNIRYAKFNNTLLNVDEIISCLPTEPNLRYEIAKNLRVNFLNLGDKKAADKFMSIQIAAEEQELKAIFQSRTQYYKEKYNILDRFIALMKYLCSKSSGLIWGYGYRINRLFYTYFVSLIILSAILYFKASTFLIYNRETKLDYWDALYITGQSMVTSTSEFIPANSLAKFLIFSGNFIGAIFIAFLAAALFRRISR